MNSNAFLPSILVAAIANLIFSASSSAVVFSQRENVNIINGADVSISATVSNFDASQLVTAVENGSGPMFWFGTPGNSIQVDFGQSRNLKTLRVRTGFGGYKADAVTIETSPDSIVWTPQTHSISNPSAINQVFTLDSAANAQYVRLTPTAFQQAPDNRWGVSQIRAFGDSGATLDPGTNLDLMSSSAITGGVAVSFLGTVSYEDAPSSDFTDDNPAIMNRKIMYNLGAGEGFKLAFPSDVYFGEFAVTHDISTTHRDPNAAIKISVSSDDVSYTTVYKNYTGPDGSPTVIDTIDAGLNFFDVTDTLGRYIKYELIQTSLADTRIADAMVFQAVIPEPSALTLAIVGMAIFAARRRSVAWKSRQIGCSS